MPRFCRGRFHFNDSILFIPYRAVQQRLPNQTPDRQPGLRLYEHRCDDLKGDQIALEFYLP